MSAWAPFQLFFAVYAVYHPFVTRKFSRFLRTVLKKIEFKRGGKQRKKSWKGAQVDTFDQVPCPERSLPVSSRAMSLPPCPHWPPWLIPPFSRLLPPLSRLLTPLQTSQPAPGTTELSFLMIGVPPSFCWHRLLVPPELRGGCNSPGTADGCEMLIYLHQPTSWTFGNILTRLARRWPTLPTPKFCIASPWPHLTVMPSVRLVFERAVVRLILCPTCELW